MRTDRGSAVPRKRKTRTHLVGREILCTPIFPDRRASVGNVFGILKSEVKQLGIVLTRFCRFR